MDDLQNWLLNAENFENNFVDTLQSEFPSVLGENAVIVEDNKENREARYLWKLSGENLLAEDEV